MKRTARKRPSLKQRLRIKRKLAAQKAYEQQYFTSEFLAAQNQQHFTSAPFAQTILVDSFLPSSVLLPPPNQSLPTSSSENQPNLFPKPPVKEIKTLEERIKYLLTVGCEKCGKLECECSKITFWPPANLDKPPRKDTLSLPSLSLEEKINRLTQEYCVKCINAIPIYKCKICAKLNKEKETYLF